MLQQTWSLPTGRVLVAYTEGGVAPEDGWKLLEEREVKELPPGVPAFELRKGGVSFCQMQACTDPRVFEAFVSV